MNNHGIFPTANLKTINNNNNNNNNNDDVFNIQDTGVFVNVNQDLFMKEQSLFKNTDSEMSFMHSVLSNNAGHSQGKKNVYWSLLIYYWYICFLIS